MEKYIFNKIIIDPILFYKTIHNYGYRFNKDIESYINNKNTNISNKNLEYIKKINELFIVEINIKPFIIILLSLNDKLFYKNLFRHLIIKWNNYKKLDNLIENLNLNTTLEKINNLDIFLEKIYKFIHINHNKNKNTIEIKKKLSYFILNSIENYFCLF